MTPEEHRRRADEIFAHLEERDRRDAQEDLLEQIDALEGQLSTERLKNSLLRAINAELRAQIKDGAA